MHWCTCIVYVLCMPVYNTLNMLHLIGVHVEAKGVEPSANSLSVPLFQSAALGGYFKGKAKSSKKPDQDSSLKPFKDDKPVWREGDGSSAPVPAVCLLHILRQPVVVPVPQPVAVPVVLLGQVLPETGVGPPLPLQALPRVAPPHLAQDSPQSTRLRCNRLPVVRRPVIAFWLSFLLLLVVHHPIISLMTHPPLLLFSSI